MPGATALGKRTPANRPDDARYLAVTQNVRRLARLLALRPTGGINTPVVHPAPPTISENTAWTITTAFREMGGMQTDVYTPISMGAPVLNVASGYTTNPVNAPSAAVSHWGLELIGDTIEFAWRTANTPTAPGAQFRILADGMPVSTGNQLFLSTVATVSGTLYYLKLVFPDSRPREIRVYSDTAQLYRFRVPITQSVNPCPKRPLTIGWIADSYGDGNATAGTPSTFQVFPRRVSEALGAEYLLSCQPGTGFYKPGSFAAFSDPTRLAALAAAKPDVVVVVGGTNDYYSDLTVPVTTVATKVTSLLTQLATLLPGIPVIIMGPQALNVGQTLSALYGSLNKAIRDAAVAQPNCIGHVDMIGNATTGTVPAAYATSTNYNQGDLCTYQGAIYRCLAAYSSTGTSPDVRYWNALSWITGTGSASGTTGDGNRDVMLYNDGTHPTLLGQDNLVAKITYWVLQTIRNATAL